MNSAELKEWREAQALTHAELARLLNVDVMTVLRWERGTRATPRHLGPALRQIEQERTTKTNSVK